MNKTTWNFFSEDTVRGASKALAALAAAFLLLFAGEMAVQAAQQDSTQSVAEAARKARARKKSAKPVKTIDDDTIRKSNTAAPVDESESTSKELTPDRGKPESEKAADAEAAAQKTADLKDKIEKEEAELKSAKEQLVNAQKDTDLAQRDFNLQKEQFYAKADASRDTAGKAQLDGLEAQISARQQNVERIKAKIVVLEDLLRQHKAAAGVK
ncbi:MAG: hypothetical protein LAN71_04420 [Acidobacteriia bacterium]|nr:hypothetical protein [Terriglobia bacterium]